MSGTAWGLTIVGMWYAGLSLVSLAQYGFDKLAAKRGWRRVPERRLRLVDLLGGWPGGLAGQQLFRHKRRKRGYMVLFWTIVALHGLVWCGVAWLAFR